MLSVNNSSRRKFLRQSAATAATLFAAEAMASTRNPVDDELRTVNAQLAKSPFSIILIGGDKQGYPRTEHDYPDGILAIERLIAGSQQLQALHPVIKAFPSGAFAPGGGSSRHTALGQTRMVRLSYTRKLLLDDCGHSNSERRKTKPLHLHPNCDEVLHVISGHIVSRVGDKEYEMKPGDTVRIPEGTWHDARNIGNQDAVLSISFSSPDRLSIVKESMK